jgi:predicted lipoprotein with Yx(FWY)xxD motif
MLMPATPNPTVNASELAPEPKPGRRRRLRYAVASTMAVGALAAGALVAGNAAASPAVTTPTLRLATVGNLGKVLVNRSGRTLYLFEPDKQKKVTCTASCAEVWPQDKVTGALGVGAGLKSSLIGNDKNPSHQKVVTYNHWPLYTFVKDTKAGQAHGQNLDAFGGTWHVVNASGRAVTKS